jgi:RNA polymerase sigma-70 factor, ECF subfamily
MSGQNTMTHTRISERKPEYAYHYDPSCGDVEEQVAQHCERLIARWLRSRVRSPELIEDIRQETLLRVLVTLREQKLNNPARLSAFVIGICKNVRREFTRHDRRYMFSDEAYAGVPDSTQGPEAVLMSKERKARIQRTLAHIPRKDSSALAMVFLDERSRTDVCGQLGLNEAYFRVLLYRAKLQFRKRYPLSIGVNA